MKMNKYIVKTVSATSKDAAINLERVLNENAEKELVSIVVLNQSKILVTFKRTDVKKQVSIYESLSINDDFMNYETKKATGFVKENEEKQQYVEISTVSSSTD